MEAYAQVSLSATGEADAFSKAVRGFLVEAVHLSKRDHLGLPNAARRRGIVLTLNLHDPCITPP